MFEIKKGTSLVPPTEKTITDFDEYYRVTLPKDYTDFLKMYNGAVPVRNTIKTKNKEYLIEMFLCLINEENREEFESELWRDIEVVITELDERLVNDENLLGMNIIPIAALFSGDFLCLDFRDDITSPNVCVWLHEESDEFSPVVEKIATNFSKFLDKLS